MPIIFDQSLVVAGNIATEITNYLKANKINVDFHCANFIKDDLHGLSLLFIGNALYDHRSVFFAKKNDLIIVYYGNENSEPESKLFKEIEDVVKFIVDFLVDGKVK